MGFKLINNYFVEDYSSTKTTVKSGNMSKMAEQGSNKKPDGNKYFYRV
jgi:hypothetical protein